MTTQTMAPIDPREYAIEELINASYLALDTLTKDLVGKRNAIDAPTFRKLNVTLRLRSALDEVKRLCPCT